MSLVLDFSIFFHSDISQKIFFFAASQVSLDWLSSYWLLENLQWNCTILWCTSQLSCHCEGKQKRKICCCCSCFFFSFSRNDGYLLVWNVFGCKVHNNSYMSNEHGTMTNNHCHTHSEINPKATFLIFLLNFSFTKSKLGTDFQKKKKKHKKKKTCQIQWVHDNRAHLHWLFWFTIESHTRCKIIII